MSNRYHCEFTKDASTPDLGGLEKGDARAVFKNVSVDMRQYKKCVCSCMLKLCNHQLKHNHYRMTK